MKIILSGGGTLGPVVPLLAIYETYHSHDQDCQFVWIGTKKGPEKDIVELYNIPFFVISCGKMRRYLSFFNLIDVFKIIIGFWQSLVLLVFERPNLLISAGGFVSVPLHAAAFVLGIPTWIHQQDARVGLANKLMAPMASKITTALQESVKFFSAKKTQWLGSPVRELVTGDRSVARDKFKVASNCPVIFAFGGGTGSSRVNQLIVEALPHLDKTWQVIHLTGKERSSNFAQGAVGTFKNYHPFKFFTSEMKDAYAIADVVVCRGGFVTITELAALSKPAIILPMSGTHQEENVLFLASKEAAVVLDEKQISGLNIAHAIRELVTKPDLAKHLGSRLHEVLPPASPEEIVKIISEMIRI